MQVVKSLPYKPQGPKFDSRLYRDLTICIAFFYAKNENFIPRCVNNIGLPTMMPWRKGPSRYIIST